MALLSKALSAIGAPNANPSINGGRRCRCPGSRYETHPLRHRVSNGALSPPFLRPVRGVDLDDGGVDHGVFHIWFVRDGLEQPPPHIRLHPAAEPRIHADKEDGRSPRNCLCAQSRAPPPRIAGYPCPCAPGSPGLPAKLAVPAITNPGCRDNAGAEAGPGPWVVEGLTR